MVSKELQTALLAATGNAGYTPPALSASYPVVQVDALAPYVGGMAEPASWNGDKFLGGFGLTKDYEVVDHWLLRKRSKQLFTENLYARGLIRRLLTNEIHTGLKLEATPDAGILGLDPQNLADWGENTERRFSIWGQNPELCDYKELQTFGTVQRQARLMALVSGDVLVLLRQNARTGLPSVELIDADAVATPESDTQLRAVRNRGNTITDGVELDSAGRHVAFFVLQANGTSRRVPAKGPQTRRLQAWLLYGTEKLVGDVRGQSLLGLVLQSLKEMDRGRDAELRAMVVNSMIAMWIEKTEDKMSTLPMTGGAVRRDTATTQNDSQGRKDVTFSGNMPGMVMQELQTGEKPTSYDTRRPNVNWATFENAILSAIAWASEVPPETLMLQFQNNYSASRGATNEFRMYLDRVRTAFGSEFCNPIYTDWLISEVLNRRITAPGFFEAWQDRNLWDRFGAWTSADWAGAIKPNVDLLKEVKAYELLAAQGWITRDRASRELTGMKFSKSVQQLAAENRQLAEALEPLLDAGLIKDENPDRADEMDTDQEEGAANG